jgi:hypothetical protein
VRHSHTGMRAVLLLLLLLLLLHKPNTSAGW